MSGCKPIFVFSLAQAELKKCCSLYSLGLVHGVVVVIYIGIVTLQLIKLDVDDPLFIPLGHQASILVLTAGVVLSPGETE